MNHGSVQFHGINEQKVAAVWAQNAALYPVLHLSTQKKRNHRTVTIPTKKRKKTAVPENLHSNKNKPN